MNITIQVGTFLGVLVSIIIHTRKIATMKHKLDIEITRLQDKVQYLDTSRSKIWMQLENHDKRIDTSDISLAEIKTKLVGIESLLLEIRKEIKHI